MKEKLIKLIGMNKLIKKIVRPHVKYSIKHRPFKRCLFCNNNTVYRNKINIFYKLINRKLFTNRIFGCPVCGSTWDKNGVNKNIKNSENRMKILHVGYSNSVMVDYSNSLIEIGYDSKTCSVSTSPLGIKVDYTIVFDDISNWFKDIMKLLSEYNIFHFHFGLTFLKDLSDVDILKKLNKKSKL